MFPLKLRGNIPSTLSHEIDPQTSQPYCVFIWNGGLTWDRPVGPALQHPSVLPDEGRPDGALPVDGADGGRALQPQHVRHLQQWASVVKNLQLFHSLSPRHRSYIFVCLREGATRIFTAIPLFYHSLNKSPLLRDTPSHWKGDSAQGGGTHEDWSTNYFFRIEKLWPQLCAIKMAQFLYNTLHRSSIKRWNVFEFAT